MGKYRNINDIFDNAKELSLQHKIQLVAYLFDTQPEFDNQGQIVFYTNVMKDGQTKLYRFMTNKDFNQEKESI